eukprot:3294594-Amphidinium_carterae.1
MRPASLEGQLLRSCGGLVGTSMRETQRESERSCQTRLDEQQEPEDLLDLAHRVRERSSQYASLDSRNL